MLVVIPADNSTAPPETLLARTGPVALRSTAHAAPHTHRALQQALQESGVGGLGGPWPAAQSLLYDSWEVVVSRLGVACAGAGAWGPSAPQGPCHWPEEGHVVEGLRCKAALLVHRLPEVGGFVVTGRCFVCGHGYPVYTLLHWQSILGRHGTHLLHMQPIASACMAVGAWQCHDCVSRTICTYSAACICMHKGAATGRCTSHGAR